MVWVRGGSSQPAWCPGKAPTVCQTPRLGQRGSAQPPTRPGGAGAECGVLAREMGWKAFTDPKPKGREVLITENKEYDQ